MSHKIKIVFMINNLYGGGAEKILQTLINQLDKYEKEIIKILLLHGNQKADFIDWG